MIGQNAKHNAGGKDNCVPIKNLTVNYGGAASCWGKVGRNDGGMD